MKKTRHDANILAYLFLLATVVVQIICVAIVKAIMGTNMDSATVLGFIKFVILIAAAGTSVYITANWLVLLVWGTKEQSYKVLRMKKRQRSANRTQGGQRKQQTYQGQYYRRRAQTSRRSSY